MLALVPAFHAVVEIQVGDRAHGFVIEGGEAERFLQIFLEILDGFQFFGQGGFPLATGGGEELLEAAVRQRSDLISHDDAGAYDDMRVVVGAGLRDAGYAVALDARTAAGGRFGAEAGTAGGAHVILERQFLQALTAKEHRTHYMPRRRVLSPSIGCVSNSSAACRNRTVCGNPA